MPRRLCLLLLLCLLDAAFLAPRATPQSLSSPAAPDLRDVVRRSGTIFAGTVTAIELNRAPSSVATVHITFHVDQIMQGSALVGTSLSINEWAGLWSAGPHYRIGERLVLFLYPTSKLGLTSPVAGEWGRLPVARDGRVRLWPGWEDASLPRVPSLTSLAHTVRRLAEER
jgi:hypothetical protein